ncbi:hypothetical protein ABZ647_30530 [Micromonospora aurantiaca]|uniref:hypothetical protein n=1 Tax=Micromonospora TaxID=1873 RepID=UPI0008DA4CA0|nr:hypothetical protein [Micromonospora sp. WMMB235]
MTITLPTEEDLAERPGEPPEHRQRAAAQRPLQRGDNPAVDALADALVLAATKAVDWVFETGGPKAWAWGNQTVADWKSRRARAAVEPAASVEVEPVAVQVEPADVTHVAGTAVEADKPIMSWTEVQQRLRVADAAEQLRDQQIKLVLGSRIVDDGDLTELGSAAAPSTQAQVGASDQLMLQATPSLAGADLRVQLDGIRKRDCWQGDGTPVQRT